MAYPNESELQRRAIAGEVQALERLVVQAAGPVHRLTLVLLGSPARAEAVLREAFADVQARLASLAPTQSFGAEVLVVDGSRADHKDRRTQSLIRITSPSPVVSTDSRSATL